MVRLRVRPQTLYAYVSRGRLRAEPEPADPRRSRYRASDVAALAERQGRGRKAADVARAAIAWGEPVLTSAITTIQDGELFYRGRNVRDLARVETLESVARLLRGGLGDPPSAVQKAPTGRSAKARAFAALALRVGSDGPAAGRAAEDLAGEAAELLDLMAAALLGEEEEGPLHERVGRAWRAPREAWDLLRQALVLLADHELNTSAFAARVAASTGSSLAASLLAGLSALSGPRHGGAAEDVEAFAAAVAKNGPAKAIAAWQALRGYAPGFGHALYPDGDPRAAVLLEAFEAPAPLMAARRAVEEETGRLANIDFALAALRQALELPAEAPFVLFALARSAGWAAHAMEQLESGQLIRPRARYVGPAPERRGP